MPLKNVRERKSMLRAKYKKLRSECPANLKLRLDNAVAENFLRLEEYKSCKTLFTFVSMPIECDTHKIIERAFKDGKAVAVPKCRNKNGEMDFYYIASLDDLKKGCFSTLEPYPEKCGLAEDFSDALCIVPGLCFDFLGYRLGFGGGYYDRFLEKFSGVSVGICYSKCIEKELPRGVFDKQTDILVTEKFINYKP